jgi:pyridoxal phosphate enzyme (YggS family)
MSIADNLGKVSERIQKATERAGRPVGDVRLLAVSKTRTTDELRAAIASGQKAFGENYLQEALEKIAALADTADLEWHFIGPIQSNKTRAIAEHFHWVHSVDRIKVAQRLDSQRPESLPPLSVCIQVNLDNEASKSGVPVDQVPELAAAIRELPRLRLRGLMAIPDPDQPSQGLRARFAQLRGQLQALRQRWPQAPEGSDAPYLDTLSMGMSDDLEDAIAEGATLVRVGTALFGSRT